MIRGVNLGNWLVLEKWMSPKLFDGTDAEDESHLCADLDRATTRERLKVHRDSYVTERDFAYIASMAWTRSGFRSRSSSSATTATMWGAWSISTSRSVGPRSTN